MKTCGRAFAGGDDYLIKPVRLRCWRPRSAPCSACWSMQRRLVAVTEELYEANRQLNSLIERDALTGPVNRRGFDRVLHEQIRLARREQAAHADDVRHRLLPNNTTTTWATLKVTSACRPWPICWRGLASALAIWPAEWGRGVCADPAEHAPFRRHDVCPSADRAAGQRQAAHPASPVSPYVTVSGGITTCAR